ncbi:MAG TPA: 1-deoxy-D-xylulose-5-phosphate synthase [bacterium]|nr:1-deoxy-D-xylulose-5-phosphate synthase [bacterium]
MSQLLDSIQFPSDIKHLSTDQLKDLAAEIRRFLVKSVSITGGHLAPNLGVVELTLALHRVFDFPRDRVVWDVGHQAYIHKILTGRKERFHTLRQLGGISGFPKVKESEYDSFGTGHSSTAISAALGMAAARDLKSENHRIVAVVGDGALTGGEAFEGLNNAGGSKRELIVVLNDNRMSISPNVGALSRYLTKILTRPEYNRLKNEVWDLTGKLPRGSQWIRNFVHRFGSGLKNLLVPGLLFEQLGFRYIGPIDGHDLPLLIRVFSGIKRLHGPLCVHVVTTKGKGCQFAEDDATKFHGLGSFCYKTGAVQTRNVPAYTEIFGKTLVELAEKDERIVGVTAAMADGTGMAFLQKSFPERFFDVGIAEQHAVTFAAALALEGLKPVVAIYSTFLQRGLDQVIHDVALQKAPVVLAMDRAGLVGEDGPTHHGSFDLSFLRFIPDLVIMAPKDENELRDMMMTAVNYTKGPVAIRYPRGLSLGVNLRKRMRMLPVGKAEILREGDDLAVVAVGDRVYPSLSLAEKLNAQGISTRVINARTIKPLDEKRILESAEQCRALITLENNSIIGGLGSAVAELLAEHSGLARFRRFGLPDTFVTHGKICDLMKLVELDEEKLSERVMEWFSKPHAAD